MEKGLPCKGLFVSRGEGMGKATQGNKYIWRGGVYFWISHLDVSWVGLYVTPPWERRERFEQFAMSYTEGGPNLFSDGGLTCWTRVPLQARSETCLERLSPINRQVFQHALLLIHAARKTHTPFFTSSFESFCSVFRGSHEDNGLVSK